MLADQSVIFSISSSRRHAPAGSVRQFEVSFGAYTLMSLNQPNQTVHRGKPLNKASNPHSPKIGLLEFDATASTLDVAFDLVALFFGSTFL